jgi:hypothetical protein
MPVQDNNNLSKGREIVMDLKSYIKMELDGLTRNIDRTLKDLTQTDITWRPAAGCNSIGLILYHCARSEDSFINRNLAQRPQVFEKWYQKMNKPLEDGGAHYTIDQVNAFEVPALKDILAYWAEVRQSTLAYLAGMSEADMDRKVNMMRGEVPVASVFTIIVSHTAGHIGEMAYLRGLYRGMDK